MNHPKPQPKESKAVSTIAWLLVVIGVGPGIYGLSIAYHDPNKFALSNLASLGSFYQGTVASIWALAGLLFIYETLRAQKRQLQQQDEELKFQEQETVRLEASRKRQNFETAFFQLLDFQNKIGEQLYDERRQHGQDKVRTGRSCFMVWFHDFHESVNSNHACQNSPSDLSPIMERYEILYRDKQARLGHYFRTVYHVFKFCKESGLSSSDLKRYTSLARAQLSAGELFFLFYNGLSERGKKFKPLIEEFGLLEHLDLNTLFHPSHKDQYSEMAYR